MVFRKVLLKMSNHFSSPRIQHVPYSSTGKHNLTYHTNTLFPVPTSVLVSVPIAMKSHHDHGNAYKREHLIGAALPFQRFGPLLSCRKQGCMQVDMVLERQPRVLRLDYQAERNFEPGLKFRNPNDHPFLQQYLTTNNVIPYESIMTLFIQITTISLHLTNFISLGLIFWALWVMVIREKTSSSMIVWFLCFPYPGYVISSVIRSYCVGLMVTKKQGWYLALFGNFYILLSLHLTGKFLYLSLVFQFYIQ